MIKSRRFFIKQMKGVLVLLVAFLFLTVSLTVRADNTSNADNQIFTGKGLKVGVIQGGCGSTSILKTLREAEGIDAQPLTLEFLRGINGKDTKLLSPLNKALIDQCQVLVLPLMHRVEQKRIDFTLTKYIDEFVRSGGGLIMTAGLTKMAIFKYRDVCVVKRHSQSGVITPWEVTREHPVTSGLELQEEYTTPAYCVDFTVGANGIALGENLETGNPVLVIGPHGKGRFVSCGMLIGVTEKWKDVKQLTTEESKLVVNAVNWCGKKE